VPAQTTRKKKGAKKDLKQREGRAEKKREKATWGNGQERKKKSGGNSKESLDRKLSLETPDLEEKNLELRRPQKKKKKKKKTRVELVLSGSPGQAKKILAEPDRGPKEQLCQGVFARSLGVIIRSVGKPSRKPARKTCEKKKKKSNSAALQGGGYRQEDIILLKGESSQDKKNQYKNSGLLSTLARWFGRGKNGSQNNGGGKAFKRETSSVKNPLFYEKKLGE